VDKAKASSSKIKALVEALAEGGNGRIEGEKGEFQYWYHRLVENFKPQTIENDFQIPLH
jgi:hypothetical protein